VAVAVAVKRSGEVMCVCVTGSKTGSDRVWADRRTLDERKKDFGGSCCMVEQREDDKPGLLPRCFGGGDCQGRLDGVSVAFYRWNKRKIGSTS